MNDSIPFVYEQIENKVIWEFIRKNIYETSNELRRQAM
jgi:uncharacterized protein with HEPN domain